MTPVRPDHVLVAACGPAAIRVTGCSGERERDWRVVHHLARRLAQRAGLGLTGSIPTYESVLVEFDPMLVASGAVSERIRETLESIDPGEPLSSAPQTFTIPVLYGGEMGPDLDDVARVTGLGAEDVIRVHLDSDYTVRCLGAPGGSPMLDGPFPVPVPRLASPRSSVPAGVVSVAGRQATVAPASAPGGWSVIGRTPLTLLDLTREPLVPYAPGDTMRFTRIDEETFAALIGKPLQADPVTR